MNRFRIKNIHTKLLLTLLLISIFLSSVLSLSLYQIFRSVSLETAKRNSMKALSQSVSQVNLIRDKAVALGKQLMADPTMVRAAFYRQELTPVESYQLYRKIRNVMVTDPAIHSVCVYNANIPRLYDYFSVEGQESARRRMLEVLSGYKPYSGMQFVPGQITYRKVNGETATDNVITTVITDTIYVGEALPAGSMPTTSAILINLNADVLQSTLMSDVPDGLSDTLIVNGDGMVVFDAGMTRMGQPTGEDYVRDILALRAAEGETLQEVSGEDSLLIYRKLEAPDWTFLHIYHLSGLLRETDRLRLITLFVSGLAIVLSAVYAFVLSGRISSPFDQLLQGVRKHPRRSDDLTDEEYLSQTFQDLSARAELLESSLAENTVLLQREILIKLAKGPKSSAARLARHLEEQNKALRLQPGESFSILAFEFGPHAPAVENSGERSDSLLYSSLEILVSQAVARYFYCEPIEHDGRYILLLAKFTEGGALGAEAGEKLRTVLRNLQAAVHPDASCYVGRPVTSLTELYLSYNNALDLARYRFVFGRGCFLTCDMEELTLREPYVPIDREKENLLKAIKSGSAAAMEKGVDQIISLLSVCQYDYIRLSISEIMFDIVKSVYHFYETDSIQVNFNNIYNNVNALDTLEEVREFLRFYCGAVIRKIEARKSLMKSDMMREMTQYITNHFQDYELSVESLADMVKLSPGYFGKLFRENTGKSVNEFLNELRMKSAGELLTGTTLTVNEISNRVGFNNSTYFITTFKKYYGMSPSFYRKETCIKPAQPERGGAP